MAKTLAAHRSGLLAYYDVMITPGPMEGTNNKIKTIKRQAYGSRDKEFFKLKILAIHESKYKLAMQLCSHASAGSAPFRKMNLNLAAFSRLESFGIAGRLLSRDVFYGDSELQ